MKTNFILSIFIISSFLISCRTLDLKAETVLVTEKSDPKCKNLGVVNVDWSWWGFSTESLNALRNQTSELGGNTLVQTGDHTGIAYLCPMN